MAKVLLHIQTLSMIDEAVLARNMAVMFYMGRHTKHEFPLFTPFRTSIDRGRNEAAKLAMDMECDYLWFLDDDMIVDPKVLDSMIAADKDVVMAHSYIRGYPYRPMCFKWKSMDKDMPELEYFENDDDLYALKDENGYCEVAAVGFTCALIKTSLLKKLSPPFFITNPHGGGTEDVHFCLRAKFEIGMDVSIAVDLNYPTSHLGMKECINSNTVPHLRKYHEAMNPSLVPAGYKKDPRGGLEGDRTEEYNRECLEA